MLEISQSKNIPILVVEKGDLLYPDTSCRVYILRPSSEFVAEHDFKGEECGQTLLQRLSQPFDLDYFVLANRVSGILYLRKQTAGWLSGLPGHTNINFIAAFWSHPPEEPLQDSG